MYAYNDDVEANLDMAQKPGLEGRARAFESSSRALKPWKPGSGPGWAGLLRAG